MGRLQSHYQRKLAVQKILNQIGTLVQIFIRIVTALAHSFYQPNQSFRDVRLITEMAESLG